MISRAGASDRHSGISAGASISPEPCAVEIISDQSASVAGLPGVRRCRRAKRRNWCTTTPANSPPVIHHSMARSITSPDATAAATSATDAACPTAIGTRARSACPLSRARTPRAAANSQPVAGFSPCRAPRPATASHGSQLDTMSAPPQAPAAQHEAAGVATGAVSYRSWWRTHSIGYDSPSSLRPNGVKSRKL